MIEYDAKSWLTVALHLRGSVLPRVAGRIVLTTVVGVVAQYLYATRGVKLAPLMHTLLGVALGLLLVFRTNASYDRWWEGRRLLGAMVNRTRDLVRQAAAYMPAPEAAVLQRHTSAYFVLACRGLRAVGDRGTARSRRGPSLDDVVQLSPAERSTLEPCGHRANVVSKWISAQLAASVKAGVLTEQRLQLMDANLSLFNDYIGACERIAKTPLPLAYAQHTKMLVAIFCFTAPFALAPSMGWLTPVGAAVLAFALFGVDEIGVEIEDPFGDDPNDLPIEAVAKTIEEDTRELVA